MNRSRSICRLVAWVGFRLALALPVSSVLAESSDLASAEIPFQPGWPVEIPATSPIAIALQAKEGGASKEKTAVVAIGTPDDPTNQGKVHFLTGDGQEIGVSPSYLYFGNLYERPFAPTLVDLDKDGKLEAIVVYDKWAADVTVYPRAVRAFTLEGNELWSVEIPVGMLPDTATVCDLEADGSLEMIINGFTMPNFSDGPMVFRLNGLEMPTLLWRMQDTDGAAVQSGRHVAVGDIDGDGKLELAWAGSRYLYRADGSYYPNWEFSEPILREHLVFGDLNQDGKDEWIAITWTPFKSELKLHAVQSSGKELRGWPVVLKVFDSDHSLAVGDINQDNFPDVIVATDGQPDENRLEAISGKTGQSLWTASTPFAGSYATLKEIAIADIDNDGNQEVVLQVNNNYLYAWRNNGQLMTDWSLPVNSNMYSAQPLIVEMDGDKELELAIGTNTHTAIWSLPLVSDLTQEPGRARVQWGDFRHDRYRTGRYTRRPVD